MRNYIDKFNYLYKHQLGDCPICKEPIRSIGWPDIHHIVHNTGANRKKFPLFIDSLLNLQILHHECHINGVGLKQISELKASKYEKFLGKKIHKEIAKFVNTAGGNENE